MIGGNGPVSKGSRVRIAACIGGTTTNVAVLDDSDNIIEEESFPTFTGGELMEECKTDKDRAGFTLDRWDEFTGFRRRLLDELGGALKKTAARLGKAGFEVAGAGVSAPGAIHPLTGIIIGKTGALNLPAWGGFNLKEELEKRAAVRVKVINDAKAMALGALARMRFDTVEMADAEFGTTPVEKFLGDKGGQVIDFIELDPGTGMGGAYIVDGHVWFGADQDDPDPDVGEIWKIIPDTGTPDINLEEHASGRATLQRVEKRLLTEVGEDSEKLLDAAGGRLQGLLASASRALRKIIQEEITLTGKHLGRGIRVIMTEERDRLSAPDIRNFVIGGGMVSGRSKEAKSVRGLLHAAIRQELCNMTPAPRILFTILGGRAGLFGSAAIVINDT